MVTAEIGDQSRSKKPLKNKRFMPRKLSKVVGRSENPGGGSSNLVSIICPPVEIGLTYLPKYGGASPAPPAPTGVQLSIK